MDVRDRLNILFQQLKYDRSDYNLTKIRFDPHFNSVKIFLTKSNLQNQYVLTFFDK